MLTRPDPLKSGIIVTRPDPTRGSIRPVDNSGVAPALFVCLRLHTSGQRCPLVCLCPCVHICLSAPQGKNHTLFQGGSIFSGMVVFRYFPGKCKISKITIIIIFVKLVFSCKLSKTDPSPILALFQRAGHYSGGSNPPPPPSTPVNFYPAAPANFCSYVRVRLSASTCFC